MSEQEFDLYLKLLSRCLNLTAVQREQVADELRDHLEERLEELARAGVAREKAVFQAIDEFGDAAVLAAHFTTIAHLKRRRFLMRLSLGSAAALAAALLVAFAFWPENRVVNIPAPGFAQSKPNGRKTTETKAAPLPAVIANPRPSGHAPVKLTPPSPEVIEHPLSSDVGQNPRFEAALESQIDFVIEPEPLKDALEFIAQHYQIPIMLDTKALEDASVDMSQEVKLPVSGIKVRQVLTLLLQQAPTTLGFDIKDGVLVITTVEKVREHRIVVVYDCRDLINLRSTYTGNGARPRTEVMSGATGKAGGTGGGMFDVDSVGAEIVRQFHGNAAKTGKKSEPAAKTPCALPEIPLITVIQYAGDPGDWEEEEGGGPKITEIGGLLVVNQNPMVHEQIKRILSDLRRMRKEGNFAALDEHNVHSVVPAAASPKETAKGL